VQSAVMPICCDHPCPDVGKTLPCAESLDLVQLSAAAHLENPSYRGPCPVTAGDQQTLLTERTYG